LGFSGDVVTSAPGYTSALTPRAHTTTNARICSSTVWQTPNDRSGSTRRRARGRGRPGCTWCIVKLSPRAAQASFANGAFPSRRRRWVFSASCQWQVVHFLNSRRELAAPAAQRRAPPRATWPRAAGRRRRDSGKALGARELRGDVAPRWTPARRGSPTSVLELGRNGHAGSIWHALQHLVW